MIKRFSEFINESIDNQEFKEYFLSLINGCEVSWKNDRYILWKRDSQWLLCYDKKDEVFYWYYYGFFEKINSKFGYNYYQISDLLTPLLGEHFKCNVVTTFRDDFRSIYDWENTSNVM